MPDDPRPLASSKNPNPCAFNAFFFPAHVFFGSLGGGVSQYPENENVFRRTAKAMSPGYSFRSNPRYTFVSLRTPTEFVWSSNRKPNQAARATRNAVTMGSLVDVSVIEGE